MTRHPCKGAARERRVGVRELVETRAPRETIPVRFAPRQPQVTVGELVDFYSPPVSLGF